jgi:colicin import membrane protein
MKFTGQYIYAFVCAAVFHVCIAALLLVTWESRDVVETVEIEKIYFIEASVVTENPIKVKQDREKRARDKKRQAQRKVNREAKRLADLKLKQIDERKQQPEVVEIKQTEEIPVIDREQQLQQQRSLEQEQVRKQMEETLAMEIAQEQVGIAAVTDDEKAMAFVSQIQREIIENWSRPPSARNGMQALLKVFLVPTGEVVNVTVVTSSNNEAFDRSAVLAVRKAEQFVVPTDARQFNRNFREFEVLFRPDDLRL